MSRPAVTTPAPAVAPRISSVRAVSVSAKRAGDLPGVAIEEPGDITQALRFHREATADGHHVAASPSPFNEVPVSAADSPRPERGHVLGCGADRHRPGTVAQTPDATTACAPIAGYP
ncbi:hypothetical protein [Kineococcus xinjiangensis]|nr:hypothetical protein [Kineococcus xinjiangensis]